MNYYYNLNGITSGPLPIEQLINLINPETLIWNEDGSMPDWKPAKEVSEVSNYFIEIEKRKNQYSLKKFGTYKNLILVFIFSVITHYLFVSIVIAREFFNFGDYINFYSYFNTFGVFTTCLISYILTYFIFYFIMKFRSKKNIQS